MKQVADGVFRLSQPVAPIINVYLVGDMLIDAGRRQDRKRIFGQLHDREIAGVALTHVHPDHQGVAAELCSERGVPLACHADDVEAMEGRRPMSATTSPVSRLVNSRWSGPPHPVDRVLAEGDEIAGFRVIHAPGHSPGEVVFFRDADRVAICGDVIRNLSYATLRPGIREPPDAFNADSAQNRASIRALAALRPSVILPGHGAAVRDTAAFQRFAERLPV
jgi:hydroxyacylglutathione hydrolase